VAPGGRALPSARLFPGTPAALSDLGVVVAGSRFVVHVLGGDGASVTSGGRAAGHGPGAEDGEHAADLVR
jgi:hypothetical protein